MRKIKTLLKLCRKHKKGLLGTISASTLITVFFLGNTYGQNVINFLTGQGANLPWTITTYCLVGVTGLGFIIWKLISKLFNFSGKKLAKEKNRLEIEKLEKEKLAQEKLEKEQENDIIKKEENL